MTRTNKFISFFLWLFNGFALVYVFTINSASTNKVPHLGDIPNVVFNQEDLESLFSGKNNKNSRTPIAIASGFKLYGIVASSNPKDSLIIVQGDNENKSQSLAIEQTLPNGGILKSVEARQITYELNGKLEIIELPNPNEK